MPLNDVIQPSRPTVNEIVSKFREEYYFVDNSFQRRLVWTEKQKVRLIETVLIGYPMPEIYLWQQPADPDTGKQRHSIVDGQQRITTLTQFVSNEWPLHKKHLADENKNAAFSDLYWRDLSVEEKGLIWNYVINTRTIPHSISEEMVRKIFTRLNETDKSLNPQELRNAEFNGEFILASEAVADNPYWRQWGVFTESQVRRMADMQLASSMLIYKRKGVIGETATVINQIYDLYNETYEDKDKDTAEVLAFLKRANDIYFSSAKVKDFFSKPVHLYTLFCVDDVALTKKIRPNDLVAPLENFISEYESNPENPLVAQYKEGASSRTVSKASRDRRVNSLLRFLSITR